jgi:hypothetical protein
MNTRTGVFILDAPSGHILRRYVEMMIGDVTRPFETIECALEFMTLLDGVVAEVAADLQAKLQEPVTERYKNGLTLASYKVQQLSSHVQKSAVEYSTTWLLLGAFLSQTAHSH